MKDFLSAKEFERMLGSFWTEIFQQPEILKGLTAGQALQSQQMDVDAQELRDLTSIQKTPPHHREVWNKLRLIRDRKSGSYLPLRYEADGAVYGAPGKAPIYDRTFTYGDMTDYLEIPVDRENLVDVTFLTNGIEDPTILLVQGIDFEVNTNGIVFHESVWNDGRLSGLKFNNLEDGTEYLEFWGYNCMYERNYLARQWGYLLDMTDRYTPEFAQSFWQLWKARYYGMNVFSLSDLLSLYLKAPLSHTTGEVVERVVECNGRWNVFTTHSAYTLDETDAPAVEEGDVLLARTPIGKRLWVSMPEHVSYMHERGTTVTGKSTAGGNMTSAVYEYAIITFDDPPATIVKNPNGDYTPNYAIVDGPFGQFTMPVTKFYRGSARVITLELDEALVPGPSTQRVSIQVYSGSGLPLFSEPVTGTSDAATGKMTVLESSEDLLRVWPDALTHRVDTVRRIAVIGAYRDKELEALRQMLEQLTVDRNQAVGVSIFTTVQATDTLSEFSTSPLTQATLSNFDAIVYDTLAGRQSTYYGGSPADTPDILNEAETQASIAALNAEITSLEQEIRSLDEGVRAVVSNATEVPDRADLLYRLCGTRGIPVYTEDDPFYKYGLFADLLPDDIKVAEVRNVNHDQYRVPTTTTYVSGTFPGKYNEKSNLPIRTEPIVAYPGPKSVVEDLDPTKVYNLDVRDVQ